MSGRGRLIILGIALAAFSVLAGAGGGSAGASGLLMAAWSNYPVTMDSAQVETNKITFTDHSNLAATCTTITATGILGGASSTPTLHPEFSGCTAFGLTSTVTSTGCDYQLHIGSEIGKSGSFDGTLDIACEAGKAIKITTLTCELKLDPAEGLGTLELTTKAGAPEDVSVAVNVGNIAYTVTKDGIGCPLSGIGSFNKADYTGTMTLSAKDGNGAATGLTVEEQSAHNTQTAHEAQAAHEAETVHEAETAAHKAKTLHEAETDAVSFLMTGGNKYPVTMDTSQIEQNRVTFTDNFSFSWNCSTATSTGTLSSSSSTLTLHPEFSGCTIFGIGASVSTAGCDFQFHIGGKLAESGAFDGTADIECETGSITISVATCVINIDSQKGLSTIEFVNNASPPGDVSVTMGLKNIAYTVTKDGIGCPLSGIGSFTKADYTGTMTLSAKDSGGVNTGLTVEP